MKKNYFTITAFLLLFINVASISAQSIPELLYYKFEGTGTSVPNLATTPPTGTATATIMGGITQGTGGQCGGGALIGSGIAASTDYLNTGWAPNLGTGSWTISFWSSGISVSSTLYYIFGDANANSFRCFTNGVAGNNNWILRGAGLTDVILTGGAQLTPTVNTFVYDSATNDVKAYLNGTLVNTVAQTAPNISGTGPFKVMGYGSNVGAPAGGLMDEFRVYNRALLPAEILSIQSPIDTSVTNSSSVLTANQTSATYQWLACDNSFVPISNETNQSFTPTVSGNYAVEITIGSCVDTSACENVTITSLNNETGKSQFNVYPNPSSGEITLNLDFNSHVEIRDVLGRLVFEKQLNSGREVINLNSEANGVYFVKVVSKNQNNVQRIIISK